MRSEAPLVAAHDLGADVVGEVPGEVVVEAAAAAGSPWGIAGIAATALVVGATLAVRRRANARMTHLRVVDGDAEAA